jgi:hypothetical protein
MGRWIFRRDPAESPRAFHLQLAAMAARVVTLLTDTAAQLREDYLRGLPKAHRTALIGDFLHLNADLLRLETGAK